MKKDSYPDDIEAARSLDELMTMFDERFLCCAYKTLMGRTPDETGRQTYLSRLRAGDERLILLQDLATSEEGRRHAARGGMPFTLRQPGYLTRLLRRIGGVARRLSGHVGPQRRLRIIENQIDRRYDETMNRLERGMRAQFEAEIVERASYEFLPQVLDLQRLAEQPPATQAIYYRMLALRSESRGVTP